ncbi:hypothetical protein K6Y31_20160 [Motilimonas cestriensis]|uniref:Uncharacterized protein n=1 Tax=Motilimonas cestriensis TaxID=2742685 RepID=A0ABS8WFI5_9GAMM|nr:hypothetical protein [Motilimonas cestriensis]MCE2597092.1 hypothetical protein [Motilimonas cestriensis]
MIDVRDVLIHPEKFDGDVVTVKGRLYSGGEKTSFIVPLYGDDRIDDRLEIHDYSLFSRLDKTCECQYGGDWLFASESELRGRIIAEDGRVFIDQISEIVYIVADGKYKYFIPSEEREKCLKDNLSSICTGRGIEIEGLFRLIGNKADVTSLQGDEKGVPILQDDIVDIVECNFLGANDEDNYIEQVKLIADVVNKGGVLSIIKIHEFYIDYGFVIINIIGKGRL